MTNNLNFPGIFRGFVELVAIDSPQDLTANWADLGSEIKVDGAQTVLLWVVLDINDSENARVRALGKRESVGDEEYTFPIRTVSATKVTVEVDYTEFASDDDQNMILAVDLDGGVPYLQFQVQTGTVGASAGNIAAHASSSQRS